MPQKKEEILKKSSDLLNAYLDQHHLKHTPERVIILTSVCRLQRFTIHELRATLTEFTISRATVYNTLVLLEKANIIIRLEKEFGVRTTQYELALMKESFVHIVCQQCGRVSKVNHSTITRMLADKRWNNFVPQSFSLYIYGHCKVCRRKKEQL